MPNIMNDQPPRFVAITDKRELIHGDGGSYALTAIEPVTTTVDEVLDRRQVVLTPLERSWVHEHGGAENDHWLVQCVLEADDVPSRQYIDA